MHYRPEIDGLRAVAVIPVLLFHAGFGFISGGFAGVDVFFVISGFLITSLIHQEIRGGAFRAVAFYERRARRLAPAFLFVCVASIPFALMWMLPKELNEFGKSLYAANLLAANFFFWDQTNYFTPDTDLMPLLHTWSLAVEEQFYIVFPLLLLSLRRLSEATGLKVIVAVTVLSFGATQLVARIDPAANFYLLPSRFWELGAALQFYQLFANAAEYGCTAERGRPGAPLRGICDLAEKVASVSGSASDVPPAHMRTHSGPVE